MGKALTRTDSGTSSEDEHASAPRLDPQEPVVVPPHLVALWKQLVEQATTTLKATTSAKNTENRSPTHSSTSSAVVEQKKVPPPIKLSRTVQETGDRQATLTLTRSISIANCKMDKIPAFDPGVKDADPENWLVMFEIASYQYKPYPDQPCIKLLTHLRGQASCLAIEARDIRDYDVLVELFKNHYIRDHEHRVQDKLASCAWDRHNGTPEAYFNKKENLFL